MPALTTTDETKLLACFHPTRRDPNVSESAATQAPGEGAVHFETVAEIQLSFIMERELLN